MVSSRADIHRAAARSAAAEATTETDYDQLGRLLQASDLAPTPGEAHGMLCGLICGAANAPERAWMEQLLPAARAPAEGGAAPRGGSPTADETALRTGLEGLARETRARLADPELGLALLLPGDDRPLAERAAALCDWVRGFLYAVGLLGVTERDLSAVTREVLKDFSNITRMDLDAVAEDEESEVALMEVAEFVWVAAMLFGEERAAVRGDAR